MSKHTEPQDPGAGPKPATLHTRQTNQQFEDLDYGNQEDFTDAERGAIELVEDLVIVNDQQQPIWSMKAYAFEQKTAAGYPSCPATVNPSLWRMATLNTACGLFKVAEGFYQVRGFDLSNMSIVEGPEGIIVIDPLISTECARAALALYYKHRGQRPVRGVIHTHSHVDHYGGVLGVCSREQVAKGEVQIVAPSGFLDHVASENIFAGTAMGRRSQYMYGMFLPKGERTQVDAGLGKTTSNGTISLIAPTITIEKAIEQHTIAGIEILFQLTPETEVPSEMNFQLPQHGVLCAAENATHNLHNVLTLRGAQVRDALGWSKHLDDMISLFFKHADTHTLFAQHHWPRWGKDRIVEFLGNQRDMWRYLHDQTLRLVNKGYTGAEIAEDFRLPEALASQWYCRGYYGTISHNVKAIYQRYMGWFDGNPADLWSLPPSQGAARYVAYMGGPAAVVEVARRDFAAGEYRWVAEVLKHVVYADPKNEAARRLQADAFEQLGYSAEAGTWRNFYLMGAQELRQGVTERPRTSAKDMIPALTTAQIFDALGVSVDGPRAVVLGTSILNWRFPDEEPRQAVALMRLRNGALTYQFGEQAQDPDCTVTMTRATLDGIITGQLKIRDAIRDGEIRLEGNPQKFLELFEVLDQGNINFPIVTPNERPPWLPQPLIGKP